MLAALGEKEGSRVNDSSRAIFVVESLAVFIGKFVVERAAPRHGAIVSVHITA